MSSLWLVLILCPFLFFQSFSKTDPVKKEDVEQKIEYFKLHLSHYRPDLNQGLKDSLKVQMKDFIKTFENADNNKKDKYYYFTRLGDLYRFAYNLDIVDSWQKCIDSYMEAIKLNSNTFEPRYYLAVHLLSSAKAAKSFEFAEMLLMPLVDSELVKDHPEFYRTMTLMYSVGGLIKDATKYAFKYLEQCPTDPEAIQLLELAYAPYYECVEIINNKDENSYSNFCTGYNIRYKNPGKINSDLPFSEKSKLSVLSFTQFYTPYAIDHNGDSIFNDISIIVYDTGFSLLHWLENQEKKGTVLLDTKRKSEDKGCVFTKFYELDLREITSFSDMTEKFSGIITLIKGEKYYYQIRYSATESTFNQNLKYFEEVEKSFRLIPSKDPMPNERPKMINLDKLEIKN